MDGANDLLTGDQRAVGPAIDSMRSMVRDGKSRGMRVFLGTLPPQDPLACCPRRGNGAGLVGPYNNGLRSMASAENVLLVDVNSAFNGDTSTLIDHDGLHPTAAGYQRIADTFLKSIGEALDVPMTPATLGQTPLNPQMLMPGRLPIRRR
jgi:lysophospholipase L1-like esterase